MLQAKLSFLCQTIFVLVTILILRADCIAQSISVVISKKDADSFAKITDKILRKELAMFMITPTFEKEFETAPKLELVEIPLKVCTDRSVEFSGADINIVIQSMKFDTIGHKLTSSIPEEHFIDLIDGKPFWGTDGGVPHEKLESVVIMLGKYKLTLPDPGIDGLYQPNICHKDFKTGKFTGSHSKVFRSIDKKRVYIFMMNSDGAGGYEVTWIFQGGKYLRRVVDYGF